MIEINLTRGTVKWYNALKRFGFIKPKEDNDEVFFHRSVVNSEGLQRLEQDNEVDFVAEKQDEAASSE